MGRLILLFLPPKKRWLQKYKLFVNFQVYDFQLPNNIDPLGQPKVTAGRDNCFRTRPPDPTFQIYKNKTTENNVRYWRDYGSGRVDHWWHLSCTSYFATSFVDKTKDINSVFMRYNSFGIYSVLNSLTLV